MAGWAIVAPMLLRTQLDLLLSCAAINNADSRSEILAYKYLFSGTKGLLHVSHLPREKRQTQRTEADRFLTHLPDGDQQEARDFIRKGKKNQYWYISDYAGPKDIIEKLSNPEIQYLYSYFSGGAHGGALGIRSWRDLPDHEHPDPRSDPSAQSLAMSGSSAFTMQLTRLRLAHRGAPEDSTYAELYARYQSHEKIVGKLFAEAMEKAEEYAESRPGDVGGP
jgi:hypothetical protein